MSDSQRVAAVVRTYMDTYNEPDAAMKARMLTSSLDEAGEYVSEHQVLNFEGVLDMASAFHTVGYGRVNPRVLGAGTLPSDPS